MAVSTFELLQTKLAMPAARVDRVARPRLVQQLDTSLEGPLTLICAPAGFGKTSLITDWYEQAARPDFPMAWLSLDEDDNDPARFLTYLISALESIGDIHSDDLLALLQSAPPPPPKVILTALLSRVEEFSNGFVLVMDDHHQLTSPVLREAFTFLLDHMPAQMHLVITSREDPPLPLSRLRGRGQLAEIRASDLRFTPEEAAQFLNQMLGVELSAKQIIDLDTRTEGWIAGLQLAALAMKGRKDIAGFISAFTGSHRYILDYLTDEVLSRQSEALQSFLLQTSILNRLSGPLCDAVMERSDGQALLEQIERGNLFLISLDDERYWYRYHHLFADMLRRQLQQSNSDSVQALHRRASEWFEQHGWTGEAIEHALLGQEGLRAAALIEGYSENGWTRGEAATLLRWLEALPKDAVRARPKLGLKLAFMLMIVDALDEAEKCLIEVEQVLAESNIEEHVRVPLLGQAAAIRASILLQIRNDGEATLISGQEALAQLPASEVYWRGWTTMIMGMAEFTHKGDITAAQHTMEAAIKFGEKANDLITILIARTHLSRIYLVQGKLGQVESNCEQLLQYAALTNWSNHPALGFEKLDHSWVRYERNDLEGAYKDVTEGRLAVQDYYLKRNTLPSYVMLARLKQLQGAETEASELLRQAVEMNLTPIPISLTAWQAWFWLMQGNHDAARQWAEAIEPTTYAALDPALEFEHMTLARIWMSEGRLEDVQRLLPRLLSATQAGKRMGRVIVISILQALAFRLQGNLAQALEILGYALSIAEPEGYVRTFVDEGEPMAELLREANKRGIAPEYVAKLLAAFDEALPTVAKSQPQHWIGEYAEALSERELEVLRLIADGASNREVAAQLYVSLGTVKKHLSNIFIKLDAHSRTQVIAVARQYKLL